MEANYYDIYTSLIRIDDKISFLMAINFFFAIRTNIGDGLDKHIPKLQYNKLSKDRHMSNID